MRPNIANHISNEGNFPAVWNTRVIKPADLQVFALSLFTFQVIISLTSANLVKSQCFVQDGNQVAWGSPHYLFVPKGT